MSCSDESVEPVLTIAGTQLKSFDYLYDAKHGSYQQIVHPNYLLTLSGSSSMSIDRIWSYGFFSFYDDLFNESLLVITYNFLNANDIVYEEDYNTMKNPWWLREALGATLWEMGEGTHKLIEYRDSSYLSLALNEVGKFLTEFFKTKLRK